MAKNKEIKTNMEKIQEFVDFTPMGQVFIMSAIQTYAANVVAKDDNGPLAGFCADGVWQGMAKKWLDDRAADPN
jgi:hypothetical protein